MYCRYCGQPVAPGDKFCRNCGREVKISKFFILLQWFRSHSKWIFIIIGIILVFIIILFKLSYRSVYRYTISQEQIALSVVNIICSNKDGTIIKRGSGTIFTQDGGILTNYHVVAKTNFCLVTLPNSITGTPNEIYLAKPLVSPKTSEISEQYDIVFLEITGAYIDERGKPYGVYPKTFDAFNNNKNCVDYIPKLGEEIKIYGYPVTSGGHNLTVTEGIISSFTDDGLILTSAKVDSGNSGGLAINKNGCFVGIPSALKIGNYQNLGVIIPKNIILDFIKQTLILLN